MAAAFEHMAKTHQIALDVGAGVLQRMAHPGLGSQMHHGTGPHAGKQGRQGLAVDQIQGFKGKALAPHPLDQGQAGPLEGRVVVRVEVVEAHHPLAPCQQRPCHGCTDEAGNTRDQDRSGLHGVCAVRQSGWRPVWNGAGET